MTHVWPILFAAAALAYPAAAISAELDERHAVFFFGGAMVDENMLDAANVFGADYEDNSLLGGGYQFFPVEIGKTKLGVELGAAGRFGDGSSGEMWGGVVGRYDYLQITDDIRISPAFTFGISHVSSVQEGRERRHEEERDGDARTLFYLAPELNLSFAHNPQTEFFWRLHHRSGAWGTLGDMRGGSNANVIGIRWGF